MSSFLRRAEFLLFLTDVCLYSVADIEFFYTDVFFKKLQRLADPGFCWWQKNTQKSKGKFKQVNTGDQKEKSAKDQQKKKEENIQPKEKESNQKKSQ